MAIRTDESGFLLGENRFKELNKGVDKVHSDTSAILSILHSLIQVEAIQRDRNYRQIAGIGSAVSALAKVKPSVNVTINTGQSKVTRRTSSNISVDNTTPSQTRSTTRSTSNSTRTSTAGSSGQSRDASGRFTSRTADTSQDNASNRDSRGRFTGSASGINEKTFLDNMKKGLGSINVTASADVSQIDPTVDAVRELSSLFAPGKKAFSLMGRGAMWLFKKRKSASAEEIPRVQSEHNDEIQRHNHEERKLLRKLIDAVNRGNSRGLAGLLGPALASLLGGGGGNGRNGRNGRNGPNPTVPDRDRNRPGGPSPAGGGGRDRQNPRQPGRLGGLLGKLGSKIPYIGALLGGAAVASNWSDASASEKGGGIGSLIGGGIGGLIGAIGGPVGSIAGATAGSYLGDSVGQKIGQWTGTLQRQDIGGTIVKSWNGTLEVITSFFKLSMMNMGRFGMMGMGGGFMRASFGSQGNQGGYSAGPGGSSGGTPSNYNPNNEVPIKRVIESGAGYNVVELADGSIIRQDGDWNWRNRNAGNISDGDFAKSRGRVDQSGAKGNKKRFAVFPTFAAGRKAKKDLLFEGQNYRNLDLMAAISRYAPPHENNTKAYQQSVLKAVGSNKRMSDYSAAEQQIILDAIQKQEGNIRQGKVTVLKAPTQSVTPQTTPSTTNGTTKPLYVNGTAGTANQAKPLYVSNSSAVKPASIPTSPNVLKRENSQPQQQTLMASSNDNISQNPADRDIAHALTGGLGMRSQMA